jgi:HAE1 family hydrophobic/amphiphilic exporter-1
MVKFSVRKPLTVFVAVLAILILGVVAFTKMTPDLLPNMDFPYVVIMTTYPGASPENVEAEVTKPLEQSMGTLEHIKNITSTSSENYSLLTLEFDEDVNMDTIGVDIQQKISALSGSWDDSVGSPYVLKINPSLLPVMVAALSMDDMDVIELSDFVDNTLMPKLEGITGVASISTGGSITRQVHVVISQEKINAVNLRLAASVNEQLDEAISDLNDTKAQLEEAQAELDSAQSQLDSGKDTLAEQTAAAEATITQQQVAILEGKMEIQQQLVSLQDTRSTLETTLSIVNPIYEKLQSLESRQTQQQEWVDTLTDARDRLSQADELWESYTDQLHSIEADESLSDEERDAAVEALTQSQEYMQAQEAVTAMEAELEQLGTSRYELPITLVAAQAQLAQVQAELAAVDATLSALDLSREGLGDSIAEMESGLVQADEAIELLNTTLTQLDEGTVQLTEALSTLSQSKSSGLLELADAATQLAVNSATVDSAMTQVDAGLDSVEDNRESALAAADVSGKLTMSTISSILAAQDFSMPAGYIEQDGISYMVSVGDEMTTQEELEELLLFDTGEDAIGPIYLSDVADIFISDNSDSTYAKLNGENGIILSFEKQSTAATAEVTENIEDRFQELEEEYPGLSFMSLMNQGDYIYMIVDSILQSLLTGALFAILVLFLFLRDIRPTIITLVSIPVSVIAAVVLMYFSGVTLNMISLSGLAVAVGMLVDNSIVVIENIYRLRSMGATAVQAAVVGTKQVVGAITASTLTTVCVFLPIVFVEGITKQLFTDLALTMGYALISSLLVALTLVPAMARGMLKEPKRRKNKEDSSAAAQEGRFYRAYRAAITWTLSHKWIVLPLAVFLLVASAWLCINRGFSYMPDTDMNTVSISLTMPEDITRDEAVAIADEALARIATVDNVETVGAMMGSSSLLSSGTSYDVTAYVQLREGCSGAAAGAQIVELCQDLDCDISYDSAMIDISYLSGSGVALSVYGNDMEDLQSAAQTIADALVTVDGISQADNGLENAEPAIHIRVDKNAAMAKGYTVAQLYMELASALTDSTTAMSMDMSDVTADVLVEADASMTYDDLASYTFEYTNADGDTDTFQLSDVAELENTMSLSSIRRYNQRRYLSVSASVDEGFNVTLVTNQAQKVISELELPAGVTYEFSGENEEIMEALGQLVLMLLLGVLLVYFIMVAQFQSLKSPFIVMFTIPLAFTGGFMALLICGMDVSIISLIGFVMLTGIIVNNGIVLVDYVNQLRAEGMERREALIEAGATRLRPILMTSLTTILGLVIMALGLDVGTTMMQPVAVVCIGGLLYATLMTLFVIPCIYDIMNKKALTVVNDEDMEFAES